MLQDPLNDKFKIIKSVSQYIESIQLLEREWCNDKQSFMVFRGEDQEYPNPCIPTIYRELALKQVNNYEINMFLAMRQNDISNSLDYLHNAIDAQHDGFPSRLLDVSYNCLVALYFATTPYYYNNPEMRDDKDGFVYAFRFKEAFSPEANNTKEIYKAILTGENCILNESFFSTNHRLIDHCKQNKRIIAQQGAFILFSGETPEPIPYYQMYGFRIAGDAKKGIRQELRSLFGIYTGSIYPEVELMNEEIKIMCTRMNTLENNVENNINAVIKSWEQEYDYFVDCCDYYVLKEGKEDTGELVRLIEKNIVEHKYKLTRLFERMEKYADKVNENMIDSLVKKYNGILSDFVKDLPEKIKINDIVKHELEVAKDES